MKEPQLQNRYGPRRGALFTVSVPATYIVPGTIFAAITSTSDESSSSFEIIFAVTDGAAVPEA